MTESGEGVSLPAKGSTLRSRATQPRGCISRFHTYSSPVYSCTDLSPSFLGRGAKYNLVILFRQPLYRGLTRCRGCIHHVVWANKGSLLILHLSNLADRRYPARTLGRPVICMRSTARLGCSDLEWYSGIESVRLPNCQGTTNTCRRLAETQTSLLTESGTRVCTLSGIRVIPFGQGDCIQCALY